MMLFVKMRLIQYKIYIGVCSLVGVLQLSPGFISTTKVGVPQY